MLPKILSPTAPQDSFKLHLNTPRIYSALIQMDDFLFLGIKQNWLLYSTQKFRRLSGFTHNVKSNFFGFYMLIPNFTSSPFLHNLSCHFDSLFQPPSINYVGKHSCKEELVKCLFRCLQNNLSNIQGNWQLRGCIFIPAQIENLIAHDFRNSELCINGGFPSANDACPTKKKSGSCLIILKSFKKMLNKKVSGLWRNLLSGLAFCLYNKKCFQFTKSNKNIEQCEKRDYLEFSILYQEWLLWDLILHLTGFFSWISVFMGVLTNGKMPRRRPQRAQEIILSLISGSILDLGSIFSYCIFFKKRKNHSNDSILTWVLLCYSCYISLSNSYVGTFYIIFLSTVTVLSILSKRFKKYFFLLYYVILRLEIDDYFILIGYPYNTFHPLQVINMYRLYKTNIQYNYKLNYGNTSAVALARQVPETVPWCYIIKFMKRMKIFQIGQLFSFSCTIYILQFYVHFFFIILFIFIKAAVVGAATPCFWVGNPKSFSNDRFLGLTSSGCCDSFCMMVCDFWGLQIQFMAYQNNLTPIIFMIYNYSSSNIINPYHSPWTHIICLRKLSHNVEKDLMKYSRILYQSSDPLNSGLIPYSLLCYYLLSALTDSLVPGYSGFFPQSSTKQPKSVALHDGYCQHSPGSSKNNQQKVCTKYPNLNKALPIYIILIKNLKNVLRGLDDQALLIQPASLIIKKPEGYLTNSLKKSLIYGVKMSCSYLVYSELYQSSTAPNEPEKKMSCLTGPTLFDTGKIDKINSPSYHIWLGEFPPKVSTSSCGSALRLIQNPSMSFYVLRSGTELFPFPSASFLFYKFFKKINEKNTKYKKKKPKNILEYYFINLESNETWLHWLTSLPSLSLSIRPGEPWIIKAPYQSPAPGWQPVDPRILVLGVQPYQHQVKPSVLTCWRLKCGEKSGTGSASLANFQQIPILPLFMRTVHATILDGSDDVKKSAIFMRNVLQVRLHPPMKIMLFIKPDLLNEFHFWNGCHPGMSVPLGRLIFISQDLHKHQSHVIHTSMCGRVYKTSSSSLKVEYFPSPRKLNLDRKSSRIKTGTSAAFCCFFSSFLLDHSYFFLPYFLIDFSLIIFSILCRSKQIYYASTENCPEFNSLLSFC
ncbi:uncharacterized protein VP01_2087g3 [Puccinia sorghi]|uniref:Uncharacterized protein n=1 Tax=Puccinia sorghi TaxID=27349 RepID=A0A0L6VAJ2_9BASI|nr:uncharacterized protein VP01_2087g3 [Puccinia sorghi]